MSMVEVQPGVFVSATHIIEVARVRGGGVDYRTQLESAQGVTGRPVMVTRPNGRPHTAASFAQLVNDALGDTR